MTRSESLHRLRSSTADDPLWYKDAVIYQVHVKSFYDSNGDGIGDFPGLLERMDYIEQLGVDTLWLMPFYESPRRDDGYDISDYCSVHPEYGNLDDVRQVVAEAHRRGMKVITELVINHTSDQHPWFQRARRAEPDTPERDFYVWSDTEERYAGTRIIFLDTEKSNWTWDPVANAYYWHRFYSHQPDLNYDNPLVLQAILEVMRFWLEMGVDGLRLDAVPYLVEREGTSNENLPETHAVLRQIRTAIDQEFPRVMLLAEANQWPEDTRPYFGDGDECHMAFHFPLMPRMYMALAQEDRFPITDILRQTPDIPDPCQWAIFLRNHDELTLEMVTDRERDYLWQQYAGDHRARLNLGIRRRLAPLMDRDRRRVELMNSLLLSMPGTPIIYYGDEIAMGDNIYLGDRDGVRTPMQWSPDRNGGFSRADPSQLVLPPIMDPLYGYQATNVEAQERDPHSLLNWTRRLLEVRSGHRAFGRGSLRMLAPANRRVLAYLREYLDDQGQTETILCVANVAKQAQPVEIDLSEFAGCIPVEMIGGSAFPPIGQLPYLLTLQPYGFYWFLLTRDTRMPSWYSPPPEPLPDFITLVLQGDAVTLEASHIRLLEREALPRYVARRRWFGARREHIAATRIDVLMPLTGQPTPLWHAEVEVMTERGSQRYQLPLAVVHDEDITGPLSHQMALARVRQGARVGFLTDAFIRPEHTQFLLQRLQGRTPLSRDELKLEFRRCEVEEEWLDDTLARIDQDSLRWISEEQSNSSVIVDDALIIKLFRKLSPGPHPEAEMVRVLTERRYPNVPPLVGEVWRHLGEGEPCMLAVIQRYVDNQGTAWSWVLDRLQRRVTESAALQAYTAQPAEGGEEEPSIHIDLFALAETLGRRLAELHLTLAQPSTDPDLAPRPANPRDGRRWQQRLSELLGRALHLLHRHSDLLSDDERDQAAWLGQQGEWLEQQLPAWVAAGEGSLLTRIHGDLHLGQVLLVQDDAWFIDFEGEPSAPLAQRRQLHSPCRDLAGMVRSLDYAVASVLREVQPSVEHADPEAELRPLQRKIEAALVQAWRERVDDRLNLTGERGTTLLRLFQLEKAAYEVGYEADSRPDWLGVPLAGLYRLVRQLQGQSPDG